MTTFTIFGLDKNMNPKCKSEYNLVDALKAAEDFRKKGYKYVTMGSENKELVGVQGVSGVQDGKLPDGTNYDWKKTDRVGAARFKG